MTPAIDHVVVLHRGGESKEDPIPLHADNYPQCKGKGEERARRREPHTERDAANRRRRKEQGGGGTSTSTVILPATLCIELVCKKPLGEGYGFEAECLVNCFLVSCSVSVFVAVEF